MSFREFFRKDVEDARAWLDVGTFGKMHDINGHKVLGIMTRHRNYGYRRDDEQGYSRAEFTLYVRSREIRVTAGQLVWIDGVEYSVNAHSVICGEVRRIELEANDP